MNYAFDLMMLRYRSVDDDEMRFGRRGERMSKLARDGERELAAAGR
jgi:hypothetical protein